MNDMNQLLRKKKKKDLHMTIHFFFSLKISFQGFLTCVALPSLQLLKHFFRRAEREEREKKKRSVVLTKKKDVCDNLPGYVLLFLSMNTVDSDLTIHRE